MPFPEVAWRSLLGAGTIVVAGTAAANVLSFFSSFAMARLLRPETFAIYTASLSLLVVVGVPSVTLQLVAARYTAVWWPADDRRSRALVRALPKLALAIGVVLGAAVCVAAPFLTSYLRLDGPAPLYVVAVILVASLLGPTCRGLLQGQHRFGWFVIATAGEYGVRLVAGLVLVVVGWREVGALFGVLIGSGVSAGLAWRVLPSLERRLQAATWRAVPWAQIAAWATPALVVQAVMSGLLMEDTLLVKHYFHPADAGAYAGLATTARVLVFASGMLSTFLFPVVARTHAQGGQTRLISHAVMSVLLGGELALLLACGVAPELVVRVVVGTQYVAVASLLFPLAVPFAAWGVINGVVSYLLATGTRAFWMPLVAAPLAEAALIARYHRTLLDVIHSLDAVMLATVAVMLVIYGLHGTWGRRVDEGMEC